MKKIIICIFTIILFTLNMIIVNAYNLSINGDSQVTVGGTISVVVNANGLTGKTVISSSNTSVLSGGCEEWLEDNSYTCVFTASSSGTASISATMINPADDDGNDLPDIRRSLTVTVNAKNTQQYINVNPTYDSNNNLSSLSIEGYKFDNEFNTDTLEYSVTLDPGTEKINIIAEKESNVAYIKGDGEVEVSEGINTFEIVVTAENGNEKVYKIIALVEEKDPIKVKINDKEYTVVKKKELLELKEGYEYKSVNINNQEVPSLYNEITKVNLVGLKNSNGKIVLYSYDTKTGEYNKYLEFKFDLMNLYIFKNKNRKYKSVNIKINDKKVPAYKLDNINDYYLLYGTNTMTGYTGYYLYDTKENSIQRYDSKLLDSVVRTKDKYLNVVLVLSSVCFLSMLFLLIEVNRDNKRRIDEEEN